jgi:tetratricopeptide (TPR) repeat protein
MALLDLNVVSTLCGLTAVLVAAFIRLHWPFRFQYISSLYRYRPDLMIRWLETSYRRNGSRTVAMLDKSTAEIMRGNYELAEKFIAEGLTSCKERPSLFNQAMVHYFFYNLSIVYLQRGKYGEALDVAFRVYERDHSLTNALGVIVCAHARLGDLGGAWEAYQMLPKKRLKPELQLFCLAEIEAAKGNFERAVQYLKKLLTLRFASILHLSRTEIEKRLEEWTKASTQAG